MFRNIAVRLAAVGLPQFRASMAAASASVQSFGADVTKAANMSTAASAASMASGSKLKGLYTTLAGTAVTAGIAMGTKMAGSLEQTTVAFTGLLGSAEKADAFIREMQAFAAETPFTFAGLAGSTQQLLALGQTTEETMETLRTVGDAVAAMGGGEENIQGVIRAMSQMTGTGKLLAQDLNQISQNLPTVQRVQIFDVLAEKLGKTREEIVSMQEAGEITAEQGIDALLTVMTELPGAAGAMERQSRTLMGVLSSLKDQLGVATAEGFEPLASAIRDTIFPLLQNLGSLLKATLDPIGEALGLVFEEMAAAFETLSPHLPALAEAFGTLVAALVPLIPVAADVLNAILIPLVPAIQAVASAFEFFMTDLPGVTSALQGLTVVLLAMKFAPIATHAIMFGQALFYLTKSAITTTGVLGGLRAAAIALQSALGPVGVAIAGLYAAYQILKPAATGAIEVANTFTEALKLQGEEAKKAALNIIAGELADLEIADAMKAAGVSVGEMANGIMTGGQAAADFRNKLTALYESGAITKTQFDLLYDKFNELGGTFDLNSREAANFKDAQRALGTTTETTTQSFEALDEELKDLMSTEDAYADALDKVKDAIDARFDAEETAREANHQKALDALEKLQEAELDAFDKRREEGLRFLEERQEDEANALEALLDQQMDYLEEAQELEADNLKDRHEAERDAIDEAHELRVEAADREARRLKDALDEQHRIEKNAFDDRMEDLRDSYDERVEEEEEAWARRKQIIQNNIDDTFGAEREHWQQVLATEEDAHEDRVDAIEEEGDRAVRTEEDAFRARQEAEDRALEDRIKANDEALKDIHEAEVKSWEDRTETETKNLTDRHERERVAMQADHDQQKVMLGEQHETQKRIYGEETETQRKEYENRHTNAQTALTNLQNLENTEAEKRRTDAKNNAKVALTDLNEQLGEREKAYQTFVANLAVIASRGGMDVLNEIGAMGADVVQAAVDAGPEAFQAFLESVRRRVADPKFKPSVGGVPFHMSEHQVRASGGISYRDRVAQVASSPILWAEAGPEAYIPLAADHRRPRAEALLSSVAEHFGMQVIRFADGGFLGTMPRFSGSSSGGPWEVNMPVSVQATVAAGVDLGEASRLIGAEVERGVRQAMDSLGRHVVIRSRRR